MKFIYTVVLLASAVGIAPLSAAQNPSGVVDIDVLHPIHPIGKNFYGLMTEEINHAYDGGLYGELIQNRAFRNAPDAAASWSISGDGARLTFQPGTDPSVKVDLGQGVTTLSNSGYWGIPVKPNTSYKLVLRARTSADFHGQLKADIQSNDGTKFYSETSVNGLSHDWKTITISLRVRSAEPSVNNRFAILMTGTGHVEFNYVSLFPPTYHGRANGNREDLMGLLKGLNPSFLRLPGGNYLEGDTIATRFEWKDTLGNPIDRVGHQGPWGYRSTDGLGLLEFLEWCEDLGMDPLLAVYAGYSLRGEHVEPGADLAPFVQDGLDEIEYVTGDASTKWGSVRAKDGHPKPFHLSYVEVGNEDWFDRSKSYGRRFAQFYDAIKAKYPSLKLIATGPIDTRKPDVVDDHYYRSARDMAADSAHYDNYDRNAPQIFVGEWASIEGNPTPTLQAALGDAAWLTGLERDSDVVAMESYAPLLVNVNPDAAQWGTNLIGYDALSSFASPSYYVQSLFASFTGDMVLPTKVDVQSAAAPEPMPSGSVGLGTWRTDAEYKDLSVTNGTTTYYQSDFSKGSGGFKNFHGTWVNHEGAYRQSSGEEGTLSVVGDPTWTNYTFRLKARKLGGDEGFLIPFHVRNENNFWRWNVGGWGDTQTRIQRIQDGATDEVGSRSDQAVEPNRWYDIRIEVQDRSIRCYLDDKLVSQATDAPRPPINPVYAAASVRKRDGHVFLKLVNFSDQPHRLEVKLSGSGGAPRTGKGFVLSGARSDVNSIQSPQKIAPQPITLQIGNTFIYPAPANSVTVLDLPAR